MHAEKWIEGIDPGAPTVDAARRGIERRLDTVAQLLPLAALHADDDVEHVHELRVATRRAMAALRLYAPLLPKKAQRRLVKTLGKTREAAGVARDLDVMIQHHAGDAGEQAKRLRKALKKRRRRAQAPIVSQWKRLSRNDLLGRRRQALWETPTSTESFGSWARERLSTVAQAFFQSEPVDFSDLQGLHRFRIHAKRLRYAMELLSPAFSDNFSLELYPVVEELQDLLGDINDHAVVLARFEAWLDEPPRGMKPEYLRELLAAERDRLEASLEGFRSWWSSDGRDRLLRGLEAAGDIPTHAVADRPSTV